MLLIRENKLKTCVRAKLFNEIKKKSGSNKVNLSEVMSGKKFLEPFFLLQKSVGTPLILLIPFILISLMVRIYKNP